MKSNVKITLSFVKGVPCARGPETDASYWDSGIPGFCLRVRDGRKVYSVRVRCRVHDTDHYVTLGEHGMPARPDPHTGAPRILTADLARDEATVIVGAGSVARREGRCTRPADAGVSAAETFQAIATRLIENSKLAEKTRSSWSYRIKVPFQSIGELPPAKVTRDHMRRMLYDGNGVPVRGANEYLKIVRWVFARLVASGRLEHNPCVGLKKPIKEQPRRRRLHHHELRAVWRASIDYGLYGCAVRRALLTGCRREEVFSARVAEFDRDGEKAWHIPAETVVEGKVVRRTKNAQPHDVPLLDEDLAVLKEVDELRAGILLGRESPWLLPSTDEPETNPYTPASERWAQLLRRAGIIEPKPEPERVKPGGRFKKKVKGPRKPRGSSYHPIRFQDLRRTVRDTLTYELGVPVLVAEAILGHAPPPLIATYAPSGVSMAEKRRVLGLWVAHLKAIVAGVESNA